MPWTREGTTSSFGKPRRRSPELVELECGPQRGSRDLRGGWGRRLHRSQLCPSTRRLRARQAYVDVDTPLSGADQEHDTRLDKLCVQIHCTLPFCNPRVTTSAAGLAHGTDIDSGSDPHTFQGCFMHASLEVNRHINHKSERRSLVTFGEKGRPQEASRPSVGLRRDAAITG
jgi:hypothetical protein